MRVFTLDVLDKYIYTYISLFLLPLDKGAFITEHTNNLKFVLG